MVTAVLFAVLWAFRDNVRWLSIYVSMHFIGTVGAIAAFLTGETLEEDTEGVPIVDELVGTHELYGKITMILAIVVSLILVFILYSRSKDHTWAGSRSTRLGIAVLAICVAIITALTAHLGGIMVWGIPAV